MRRDVPIIDFLKTRFLEFFRLLERHGGDVAGRVLALLFGLFPRLDRDRRATSKPREEKPTIEDVDDLDDVDVVVQRDPEPSTMAPRLVRIEIVDIEVLVGAPPTTRDRAADSDEVIDRAVPQDPARPLAVEVLHAAARDAMNVLGLSMQAAVPPSAVTVAPAVAHGQADEPTRTLETPGAVSTTAIHVGPVTTDPIQADAQPIARAQIGDAAAARQLAIAQASIRFEADRNRDARRCKFFRVLGLPRFPRMVPDLTLTVNLNPALTYVCKVECVCELCLDVKEALRTYQNRTQRTIERGTPLYTLLFATASKFNRLQLRERTIAVLREVLDEYDGEVDDAFKHVYALCVPENP